jgi:SAM-dependent methyltransferase
VLDSERLGPGAPRLPWVRREHDARYRFAATFARGRTVVDCACGTGGGARGCGDAGAGRVLAFDASEEAVAATRRDAPPSVEAAVASAHALPVASRSADLVVSLETIEHLEQDARFLDEVVRVLAPGGTFVCSTPDREVTNPGLPAGGRPFNPFHVREYSAAEFGSLLRARFGEVTLHGQNPLPAAVVRVLGLAGRVAPFGLATRARQAAKLAYLLPGLAAAHEVRPLAAGDRCEYLVAVCRRPLAQESLP